MIVNGSEWLVSDQSGAFAMGTSEGARTRKYHGFYMGIPGRLQTAYLVDFELEVNGVLLWQHDYLGPQGPLRYPNHEMTGTRQTYKLTELGPHWIWKLDSGELSFWIEATFPSGIRLSWHWKSKKNEVLQLKVRGFWAMRDLHELGGKTWTWKMREAERGYLGVVYSSLNEKEIYCLLQGRWSWIDDSLWHKNFHYSEELSRGYPANEDLYSAGYLETQLKPNEESNWIISNDPKTFDQKIESLSKSRLKILDFTLKQPAGVVAGFPWFGEWGRDTFVSVPGIFGATLMSGKDTASLQVWGNELLKRWGGWIERNGCLPNLLQKEGKPQWESCDATLWWCHTLASLWAYSLVVPSFFANLKQDFLNLLVIAVSSIRKGAHPFLTLTPEGLLDVTGPSASWMDARVEGRSVTPRLGILPEINALWFQAVCLEQIWSKKKSSEDLQKLGRKILKCKEADRSNEIFLHSIPLAPSFVLKDGLSLEQGLTKMGEQFWTPVGLRTLAESSPLFKPHCVGSQTQRDLCYHQGASWAWLGGNFEAARHRLTSLLNKNSPMKQFPFDKMFTDEILDSMPISGHIAELFDAEPPFIARGAPAQAWSLACFEEAKARRHFKVDAQLKHILAEYI